MNSTFKFRVRRDNESDRRWISGINGSLQDNRDYEDTVLVTRYAQDIEPNIDYRTKVKVDLDLVGSMFGGDAIPDIVLDLVELAAATFAVDKEVSRDLVINEESGEGRVNTRNIKIQFPVLSPRLATETVEDIVSDMVSHATRDVFTFDFLSASDTDSTPLPDVDQDRSREAVSLLSDGLDSTAGIYYNRENDIDSSYVTVDYGSSIQQAVRSTATNLEIPHEIQRLKIQKRAYEFTQFSRGFLHLTFGLVTALANGADNVYSFENGVVARFDVLQDGWLTTRTVSPHLLTHYNAFINEIIDRDISVSNPFEYKTKTEIVELINDTDLVQEAVSCPHSSKYAYSEYDNCNLCVPCIFRAIALVNSSHEVPIDRLGVFNSFSTANFNLFSFPEEGQVKTEFQKALNNNVNREANSPATYLEAMAELSYFSKLILSRDKSEVVQEYPSLYPEDVYQLHRRFAENFQNALDEIVEVNPTVQALTL